ncbi:acyl-CoA dehydrogenase [Suttonella sp. R2A3]|uniref:acyl-CoA dehydrogenase n=1 Tax=Suttonella sp. R2A3 TaxID=2908648 RepID=UPI001F33F0A0|nr:acyl-CoA dehydrogenase [Suttonella sp. R2A3]UJF24334.1 acyl-CoA dehydrogenase [Suttonella sp. R2A3]
MSWIIGIVCFLVIVGALAYFSAPVWLWAVGVALALALVHAHWLVFLLAFAVCAIAGIPSLRKNIVSKPALAFFKKVLPELSETEREAIDAGTVWWDAEVYSGKPDWEKLSNFADPKLSEEEQAFLDGPVEELCEMLDDWDIVHKRRDLPPEVWQFIRENGFFAMIIKKKFGGLEFSNYAHAKVVGKVASRCGTAAVTVMVPNSLGPGELLQHYGTKEQQDYYLPRLAKGEDIPCFALTSPYAGSDAGAIPDFGVVERGSYTDPRTGEKHEDVLGIRVSFEKRWMTLGPLATVFGLAFKLKDPNKLLGDKEDIGITCALLPKGTEGLLHERRHYPNNSPFMNGPVWGKDVFFPVEWIIGGQEFAGQGWRMLMECLSVGRCISLPALSVAAGKACSYTTAAYSGVRHQFGLPIGKFEGVDEALARIGGYTYQMESAQDLAMVGLDSGEKPSVISAILKYHNTERMRYCINDAMDIHGGRAVVTGPRNYLASAYNAIPVAITVEGANILTRSMMIFGQGAFRCHRYVLEEIYAVGENDLDRFDKALAGHIKQVGRNKVRSLVLGVTNGAFTSAPSHAGKMAKYYRQINRLSAAFAFTGEIAMVSLGGSLKFREKLSARLGDAFSNLYIASAVLKRFQRDGSPDSDLPFAQWAVEKALFDAEDALAGFIDNLPARPFAWVLKVVVFPLGRRCKEPSDRLGTKVTRTMMEFGPAMERLTRYVYVSKADPRNINEPTAALMPALKAIRATEETEKTIRKAERNGELTSYYPDVRLDEAVEKGLISAEERDAAREARELMRLNIVVDDFDMQLEDYDKELFDRVVFLSR